MRWWIDGVGVTIIALNVLLGFRYGLLRRGLALAALWGGLAFATLVGNGIERWAHGSGEPNDFYASAWTYIGIFILVVAAIEVLGALYDDKITRVASLMFDRTTGAIVGVGVGFLEIAIICLIGLAVGDAASTKAVPLPDDRGQVSDSVRASFLGGRVNSITSGLENLFNPALPKNLSAHLAEPAAK